MTNLPPLPKDRNWSPETWRAGLDEAVRRDPSTSLDTWQAYCAFSYDVRNATIAHATTLLDAGIVKPVVSEAVVLLRTAYNEYRKDLSESLWECSGAIAIIQSALDKARAGE